MRKIRRTFIKELFTTCDLVEAIDNYKNKTGGKGALIFFDTETTGLNIKYDLPFLLPWGFIDKYDDAYVYCVDVDKNEHLFKQTALAIVKLVKDQGLVGHNIKYDIHSFLDIIASKILVFIF